MQKHSGKNVLPMLICVLSVFCRGRGTVDALMCSVVSKFITQMVKDGKLFESNKNIMGSTNIALPLWGRANMFLCVCSSSLIYRGGTNEQEMHKERTKWNPSAGAIHGQLPLRRSVKIPVCCWSNLYMWLLQQQTGIHQQKPSLHVRKG